MTIGLLIASQTPGTAAILNQPMTGATASGWVIGGAAYLTASTGYDMPGNGWLRLTEPAGNQSGYAFYDSAFDISSGVIIQFDYATWGGTGADGYSIYLFDGAYNSATFNVGASGGSLGYDKKTVAPVSPGLSGGYIGVGIDEFGNFSNPTEGRLGGPGQRPNSVAVRGPYDHPSGAYYYIGGTAANVGTLWFNQAFRPSQTGSQYRKVVIYLTPVAAPQFMQVDVFMQFGYNQPLTYLINTLYTMRPIPASVKVGYAASTGGSTNYHEIRNLAIDNLPTNINLAMAKTASTPIVAPGGALTYTVTARNYGPNLVTVANNVPIVDTVPAALTGVTWTCAGSGGGTCGAASGSGNNINTTATLPFNAAATYTINGTVAAGTPLGTIINNTATLTPPAGITDYNPADNSATVATTVSNGTISISGTVYNDSGVGGGIAHNGVRDGTEAGVNGITYYAKLFRTGDLTTTVVPPVTVSNLTGLYTFNNVPNYGNYIVILSSTNTANVYDPSFPNANWIYVAPLNYTLSGVVASGTNLTNQNFFLYNGSRIAGKVIKDDGFNGSISTAYDGILNAAETGIAGVTVTLRNATGLTTLDTSITDADGNFVLFTNNISTILRIYQNNLPGYTSVSYNAGTTGGAYTIAGEYLQFNYTLYTDYTNILFGDVPAIVTSFSPTPLSGTGFPSGTTYYAHTFNATGRGSVAFTTSSRTQGGWPAIAYVHDSNCNGSFDAGEPDITAAINVEAAENICILVREAIPAGVTNGMTDSIVSRATFSAGLATPLTSSVTDTTTIAFSDLSSSSKSWVNRNGGDPMPTHTIRYTIVLKETTGVAANNVSVSDLISTSFSNFTVVDNGGGTDLSTPGTGPLNITGISVPAGGSVNITFDVTIPLGTPTGTTISNSAIITVTGGIGTTAVALPLIVNGGSVPGSGSKPLYLYNGTSTPANKLSRTPMPTNDAAFVTLNRFNTQTWTLSPALASAVTINSGTTIPVELWLGTGSARRYSITTTLRCGTTDVATENQDIDLTVAAPARYPFNLNWVAGPPYTCPAGSTWSLDVNNGGNRTIYVYTARSDGPANVALPSQSIINIDNSDITFHTAAYPAVSGVTTVNPGDNIYIRATVSDPFGDYDITGAALTLTDASGTVQLYTPPKGVPLTDKTPAALQGGAIKIYEYGPYTVPGTGPSGNWSARVVADEGTEGVSDYGIATLTVASPVPPLSIIKWSTTPSAKPGQNFTYWIQVDHSGSAPTSNVYVDDYLSPYLYLAVDTYSPGVHVNFIPGTSGLTADATLFSQTKNTTFGYTPASGNGGAPTGTDGLVTNWRQTFTGTMNPGGQFFLQFQVQVR